MTRATGKAPAGWLGFESGESTRTPGLLAKAGIRYVAPFYHPLLLAEQIGTLAAFAEWSLIATFVLGGRPQQFQAFGMEEQSRVPVKI